MGFLHQKPEKDYNEALFLTKSQFSKNPTLEYDFLLRLDSRRCAPDAAISAEEKCKTCPEVIFDARNGLFAPKKPEKDYNEALFLT